MTTKRKPPVGERTADERAAEFLVECESIYKYLYGVADGLEASGDERFKAAIHRIRHSAGELSDGIMYVRFGYKEPQNER